ncbi:MAG: YigZ family protein [Bacteroidales bacterium]|jgi:uncharacterized YigZ family protein|nr:YigZ family protein [Bacteroidales bacterium]
MEPDTYLTVKYNSSGTYKEKGSRFIAQAFHVSDQEEIKTIIEKIKKEHHSARHNCYAYMLGAERLTWRMSDDGEPSGTAGRSILGQINAFNLTDILIVVTRYFGGILLGTSGLKNAYKKAAGEAIRNNEVTEMVLKEHLKVFFPYQSLNDVMKIIKEEDLNSFDQLFDAECSIRVEFRLAEKKKILNRFSRISGLYYSLNESE